MASFFILTVAGLGAIYVFLRAVAYLLEDSREPKTLLGTIPFVSPLIGLALEKGGYYIRMRDEHNLPIYTLRMPGVPVYVANSLTLCQRIDRHILTVAFSPIQIRACDKAVGVSKAGMEKIANDRRLEEDGYFRSFPRVSAIGASPGPGLDALSRAAVNTFAASLDQHAKNGRRKIDLFKWVRHEIFAATTDAIYGPHNPFRRAEVEKAWFDYEPSIMTLLMDVFPGLLARKGLRSRGRMVAELKRYLDQNRDQEGSLLLQVRQKHNRVFGLDNKDSAHIEVFQVAGGVLNTAPTAFWLIWKVFSDPVVLEDCRREAEQLVHRGPDGVCTIDLAQVRTACPIILSTWQEVLRFYGISVSTRIVQEDTVVDGEFLLKKGGVLLMPNAAIQSDKAIWGPSAGEFNHRRFLKTKSGRRLRHPAAAFRAFGSGHVLCPGRHFASTEVLALLTLILVRFDISPPGGKWIIPKKEMAMDRACPLPRSHTAVEISPRDDHSWRVLFSGSNEGVNIVAEDLN